MIPFNKPTMVGRELEYIQQAIENSKLSGDGRFTEACHALLTETLAPASALLTHSCTAALEMSCHLADIGPGDEVILPSYTFVSTANAVALRGATPVFIDIRPDTLNIDETLLSRALSPRTKAIIAVHYAGVIAEMDAINDFAQVHGLIVIEDAAQAYLSTYGGKLAGTLSDMSCFSFHETKNIISGEGGAFATANPNLLERAEIIREKGTNRKQYFRGDADKYSWVDVGSSYLPSELVAAFLLGQLEMAGEITNRRRTLWDRYHNGLEELEAEGLVARPQIPANCTHNGHMYYLILNNEIDRDAVIASLKDRGIWAPFHYVPLHSSKAGQRFGRTATEMAVTDRTYERLIRLPMFVELGETVDTVISQTCAAVRYISKLTL